jgi:hypothetical protein
MRQLQNNIWGTISRIGGTDIKIIKTEKSLQFELEGFFLIFYFLFRIILFYFYIHIFSFHLLIFYFLFLLLSSFFLFFIFNPLSVSLMPFQLTVH